MHEIDVEKVQSKLVRLLELSVYNLWTAGHCGETEVGSAIVSTMKDFAVGDYVLEISTMFEKATNGKRFGKVVEIFEDCLTLRNPSGKEIVWSLDREFVKVPEHMIGCEMHESS